MTEGKKKKPVEVSCADCKAWACFPHLTAERYELPSYCPATVQQDVNEQALAKYTDKTLEFARNVALIENSCYAINPETGVAFMPMRTLHPRAEEIIMLARISGYKKLGIAFGIEMQREAETYTNILEKNGFEVVSVCCKAGAISKEEIGVTEEEKLYGPGSEETMCSGLIMAEILNSENTDMNILMGLGVGQDALFYKYAEAFTIPFVVIDRVYGGATLEGLYQCFNSWGFRNYADSISAWRELAGPMSVNLRALRWPKGKE